MRKGTIQIIFKESKWTVYTLVFFQFYYLMSIIGKKSKSLNTRFYSLKNIYINICFILDSVDAAYSAIMITIITWLIYSKIAPQSAKDRHFTSSIIKGHSCSTLLILCFYFLPPRHHLYFLVDILRLLSCFSKDRLKSLWWMQHLSMVISSWKTYVVFPFIASLSMFFIEIIELH